MKLLILLTSLIICSDCAAPQVKFVQEFCIEKSVTLTILACWNKSDLKIHYTSKTLLYKDITNADAIQFLNHTLNTNWNVLDFTQCGNFENILQYLNVNTLFNYASKHMFLIKEQDVTNFMNQMEVCNILPMSEVILAIFNTSSWADLIQLYKYQKNQPLMKEYYGNWSTNTGFIHSYKNIATVTRRKNFQQTEIIIGIALAGDKHILNVDFEYATESRLTANEPFIFYDMPNIITMLQFINASRKFRILDSYGYLNHTTGEFDGLVRDLKDEKSHISGTSIIASLDRQPAIEFMTRIHHYGVKFILKKPSYGYVNNIFVTTFSSRVWMACGVVLMIFGIMLYILLNWERKTNIFKHSGKRPAKCTLSDILVMILEAVCQQGTYTDSDTVTGRILLLLLFMSFMFLYVSYSAYILVLLRSTTAIASIEELLESRIECGGANVSYLMNYYESTKDEALRKLYVKKVSRNKYIPWTIGMKKVKDENFAFQVPLTTAYNFISRNYTNYDICKLQELRGYMNTEFYISTPKASQYKLFFKMGLTRMEEVGMQVRAKNRLSKRPKCYNEAGNFQPVRIYECYSVILMYIIGLMLSLAILMMEKVVAKCTKEKSENNIHDFDSSKK